VCFLAKFDKNFAQDLKMLFEKFPQMRLIRERNMKHIALMFGSAALVGMSTMAVAGGH